MNDIERELRAHFNEPILVCFELGRLIGYGEDEDDCYLIVDFPRRRSWCTAVGGYMYLTTLLGQGIVYSQTGEIWNDFTRLDSLLELNGCLRQEEFFRIIDVKRSEASAPNQPS